MHPSGGCNAASNRDTGNGGLDATSTPNAPATKRSNHTCLDTPALAAAASTASITPSSNRRDTPFFAMPAIPRP